MKIKGFLILLILVLTACYTRSPHIQFNKDFSLADSTISVAVLDFEYSGNFFSSRLAKNIADNVSTELYITKNVKIVDRSIVKETLKKFDSTKKNKYSRDELKQIGEQLQSSYLVLGSVFSTGSIEDYYEKNNYKLEITIRFVSTESGDVVGIVRHTKPGSGEMEETAQRAVKELIRFL